MLKRWIALSLLLLALLTLLPGALAADDSQPEVELTPGDYGYSTITVRSQEMLYKGDYERGIYQSPDGKEYTFAVSSVAVRGLDISDSRSYAGDFTADK